MERNKAALPNDGAAEAVRAGGEGLRERRGILGHKTGEALLQVFHIRIPQLFEYILIRPRM
jgi:hypothetical protein